MDEPLIKIGFILNEDGTFLFVREYESGVRHMEHVAYREIGGVALDEWWIPSEEVGLDDADTFRE